MREISLTIQPIRPRAFRSKRAPFHASPARAIASRAASKQAMDAATTATLLDGVTGAQTPIRQANPSEGKNPFKQLQGGFTIGGPFSKKYFGPLGHAGETEPSFHFVRTSGDQSETGERISRCRTIAERGFLGSGASGFRIPGLASLKVSTVVNTNPNGNCQGANPSSPTGLCSVDVLPIIRPTFTAGDSVFSLFPFPNNPVGPYGSNTFTQALPRMLQVPSFRSSSITTSTCLALIARQSSPRAITSPTTGGRFPLSATRFFHPSSHASGLRISRCFSHPVRGQNLEPDPRQLWPHALEFDPRRDPSLLASDFAKADQQIHLSCSTVRACST